MPKKDLFIIIILTVFFSLVIFFVKTYFFSWVTDKVEEIYIDRSLFLEIDPLDKELPQNEELKNNSSFIENKEESEDVNLNSPKEINKLNVVELNSFYFTYIPSDFSNDVNLQSLLLKRILSSTILNDKVVNLGVELNKIIYDVRWKMKWWIVKLFWVKKIDNEELISVFIHEFAHHIDIYYLINSSFSDNDTSKYFYDISWESTKVIKNWQKQSDFISGYSMTNKYEDFAESFTYFVLHNSDFILKAEKSKILREKYNFFSNYLFKNNEFEESNFSNQNLLKDYYRDITKIGINLENFLQYLEKSI